jgi:alpha-maltose-1-phosphate synthase
MILLSHPTGNANVRQAARALNEANLLSEFWTSIHWPREHALNRVLSPSVRGELNRRSFPQVPSDKIRSHPWPEVARLLAGRLGLTSLTRHEVGRFSVDAVYESMDRRVAARLREVRGVQAVYAHEDAAAETFLTARRLGIKTLYELPIGYWKPYRELMQEEAAREPEWASTLPGNTDSSEKLCRKDEELAMAERIIVPSEFARSTLSKANCLKASVNVVPYGAPAATSIKKQFRPRDGKLKVIFVGALTQRKGLSYLLRAVEQFGPKVELTIIGRRVGECRALDRALSAHHWIPSLPHPRVLREISQNDVMVFPSLFEGFGLVLLEAMSVGVPVVTTPHGGAPDCISDGRDGFIVPIRDVEAIAEKLELFLQHPEILPVMARAALLKARRCSWEYYGQRLAALVGQVMAEEPISKPKPFFLSPSTSRCTPC